MPDDIIADALKRFEESQTVTDHNREEAREDIRFARLSEQWPTEVERLRKQEGRPCLTINKLPTFIRHVVNEAKQNTPSIKVSPVDSGADEPTAEVINGLVRSIERNGGDTAKDTAIDHAVTNGFGFFRIAIDYVHPESFDMECKLLRVPNPLMVHWDANSAEFDASDWEYAFVSEWMTEQQYELRYPGKDKVEFQGNTYDGVEHWIEQDNYRVAEYWLREEKKFNIVMLSNGQVVREDDLPDLAKQVLGAGGFDVEGLKGDEALNAAFIETGLEEVKRRESTGYEVTRRIINGQETLEEDKWPGSMIPICPVWGEEVYSEGRRHFRSLVRDARDPQRMFNYWRSASTELVALAPKAPFVGPKGFVPKGQEKKWQEVNNRSIPYLEYEPVNGAGAPQRQPFAGVPAGALQESLNANDDMKSIMGIFDSSMGAKSNETSGKAIMARERQGDVANFHFIDNLNKAIEYAGRCLVEIIPSVYGVRESIRILGEDSKEKVINLTQENPGEAGEDGERELYNIGVGKYDVTVKAGPSYATQREETRETLIEIMRQVDGAAVVLGDVLMEHMDFVGAEKVSKRLQVLLPPQVQMAEGLTPPPNPALPGAEPQQAPSGAFFNGGTANAQ